MTEAIFALVGFVLGWLVFRRKAKHVSGILIETADPVDGERYLSLRLTESLDSVMGKTLVTFEIRKHQP